MARESWSSRFGVILAVAGSAVGIGNFLRFPGNAAQYGGGGFMIAYLVSFLVIGLPICWAEWAMARYGGKRGFHSTVGVMHAISRHPSGRYIGIIGIVIPVVIYMYYVVVEAWTLGYAVNFLFGNLDFSGPDTAAQVGAFFGEFVGIAGDGDAFGLSISKVGLFLIFCFALNFFLIYRGIARGIELFCTYAMPLLIVLALIILVRVLTLGTPDPAQPDSNISAGLGFMWNPNKVVLEVTEATGEDGLPDFTDAAAVTQTQLFGGAAIAAATERAEAEPGARIVEVSVWQTLTNPAVWLAAAGQIFFSLSVGFGVIMTYASYLSEKDDVVVSGLAATSTNQFCEVALGGLITIPAAVAFLGVTATAAAGASTFAMGFNVLPNVFALMPAGNFFGFLFFFLLFLAAVTSSLSMLQPGIAFLENALNIDRKRSVALLGLITAIGALLVLYFSRDLKAMDTLDFWVGTFLIFTLASIQIILFSWRFGVTQGLAEAHKGARMRIPGIFAFLMRYITPTFLLLIFLVWLSQNIFGFNPFGEDAASGYVLDLFGAGASRVAWLSVVIILLFAAFCVFIVKTSPRYASYDGDLDQRPPTAHREGGPQ